MAFIAYLAQCGEKEMTCVTAQLVGPAKRMDALIALFTHRGGSEDLRKQLKKFQGQPQRLGEDRNRAVHDPLVVNRDSGFVHKLLATAKGELKYSLDPLSQKQMESVATQIHAAGQEFLRLKCLIQGERYEQIQQQLEHIAAARRGRNLQTEARVSSSCLISSSGTRSVSNLFTVFGGCGVIHRVLSLGSGSV